VVSGDEGGTICLWNLQDGRRQGGFSLHAAPASAAAAATPAPAARQKKRGSAAPLPAPPQQQRLTAMAFDASQRRLLTASDGGEVKAWNFSSGAVLRQYFHREGPKEITAVAFVRQAADAEAEAGGSTPRAGAEASNVGCGSSLHGELAATSQGRTDQQQSEELVEEGPEAQGDASWVGCFGQPASGGKEGSAQQAQHGQHGPQAQQAQHACPPSLQQEPSKRDSPRGSGEATSLVLAAGWSRRLCVWREGEAAACGGCQRLEGHGADVLSLALLGSDVAATGEPRPPSLAQTRMFFWLCVRGGKGILVVEMDGRAAQARCMWWGAEECGEAQLEWTPAGM
jgi:hypothetical protein